MLVAPNVLGGHSGPLCLQTARKPDSVRDDHSSRRRVTAPLQQPTRKFRLVPAHAQCSSPCRTGPVRVAAEEKPAIPAYLVLLRVGFTMRRSLLIVRCALTAPFHPYRQPLERDCRRYIFCCTGRPAAFKRPSRTLSGTLPCGVRTFLPLRGLRPGGSDHPAACKIDCSVPGAISSFEVLAGLISI